VPPLGPRFNFEEELQGRIRTYLRGE